MFWTWLFDADYHWFVGMIIGFIGIMVSWRVVPKVVLRLMSKETKHSTYREDFRACVYFSSMDVVTPSKPELNESGHSDMLYGAIANILPKLQARLAEAEEKTQHIHDLRILIKMCEFGMDEYNK